MKERTLEQELEEVSARFSQSAAQADPYEVLKTLKESPYEMTELVCDADNMLYVRKYIDGNVVDPKPYLLLQSNPCPYLPKVYSATSFGNQWVVIMEHLEGISLRKHVANCGTVSSSRLLDLFKPVFLGLDHMHVAFDSPLIHRDIKPDNIVVTKQGAKLIDFGAARAMVDGALSDTHLIGTPGYAAPEQYGFKQSDARSDIYALGKTVRFTLTGKDPQEEGGLPEARIAEVLGVACAFDPKDRYGSVRDFYNDLRIALSPPRIEAHKDRVASSVHNPALSQAVDLGSLQIDPTRQAPSQQKPSSDAPASRIHPGAAHQPLLPSQKKPSPEWRFLQGASVLAFIGMIAFTVNYAFFDSSNPNTPLSTCAIGFLLFAFPWLLLIDPFDYLRRHGFYDKKLGPRLLIVFGVCFFLAWVFVEIDTLLVSV